MKLIRVWLVKDPISHAHGEAVVYTTEPLTNEQIEEKVLNIVKNVNPQIKNDEFGWNFIVASELV